jgi:hypothetical protein
MTEELDRVLQTRVPVAGWNTSVSPGRRWKGIIRVTVGILAGSVALIGYGADSIIEVASSCIRLWWLTDGSIGRRLFFCACRLHRD